MHIRFFIGTATTMCLASGVACAQESGATPRSSAVPAPQGLSEIIVTAQRRAENLQKAAVAVDVVSGSSLVKAAISSPTQLGSLVPSLTVQSAGGANTTFFLRGVGNFTVNGYSDPAIAFNYDGVYVGRPTSTSGVLYDLERVEVLKGPQGTLYGRNATAGAINVIPARPKAGENSGFLTGSYGNYDAKALQGAVNIAMGQDGAVRVSGSVVDHNGYLSDGTSDEKNQAIRVQLLGHLTPNLTVRLAGDYSHTGGKGAGASYAVSFPFNFATGQYAAVASGLGASTGLLDPRSQSYRRTLFAGLPGRTLGPLDPDVYQNNDYYGANAEIEYKSPIGTLTIIPGFRSAHLNNKFGNPGFTGFIQENDAQYSAEARLSGKRISIFDYIVGAYYYDETVKGNYTFSQDALAAYQLFDSRTKSYAAFGRITANITSRLRLVGGLRYTKDEKRFMGNANVVTIVCTRRNAFGLPDCPNAPVLPVTDTTAQLPFAVPNGGFPIPIGTTGAIAASGLTVVDRVLNSHKLTYRGAAEFDLGPRSLLYASYETGYRSGGFSLSVGHETFQPEYITAYTIGSKNRLFDNRLQLNVEAFLWQYRNQQVNHTGVDALGNQGQFTDNVGRSINKGVEVEAQFLLTKTTLLDANIQYLDAHYKHFVYQVPLGATPPNVGCPSTIDAANPAVRDVDCSGKQSYLSPKWTVNVGAQQTVPLGDYKLVVEGDTQFKTSRYIGFEYLAFERVGSTWTTNAQVSFGPASDQWSVSGFVHNIENDRIPVSGLFYNIGSLGTVITSPPRTYGLRASMKF